MTPSQSLLTRCLPHTGIDALLQNTQTTKLLKTKHVGLLASQASLTHDFIPSAYALHNILGSSLTCLFAPEHGWSAFAPEGAPIKNSVENHTQLPLYSLYGPVFAKNLPHFKEIDTLIIDLQDVGVRCYTYAATCAKVLEYLFENHPALEILVCDRPNPLGSHVKGGRVELSKRSLVNHIDVPFQHGKTLGGLLEQHNTSLKAPLNLKTIPVASSFDPHTHIWVPPSPGLPDWESVYLYPGLVLLEGTNVSEGRGTPLPFKCMAAPNLDAQKIAALLNALPESGIKAHPFSVTPQSSKHAGKNCKGVQIHILDYHKVDGLHLGLMLLYGLKQYYPDFQWLAPKGHYWIDELTGSADVREAIDRGEMPEFSCRITMSC